jgi:hypothetical protein
MGNDVPSPPSSFTFYSSFSSFPTSLPLSPPPPPPSSFFLGAGCVYVGGPQTGGLRRQHVVQICLTYHLSHLIRNDTQCYVLTTIYCMWILVHRSVGVVNEGSRPTRNAKFGFFSKYGFKWTLFDSFSTVLCLYCLLVPNF